MKKLIISLVAVFFIFSCAKKVEVATVNGKRIFEKDIKEKMKELSPKVIERYGKKEVKKRLLDSMITRILLLNDLKQKNFHKKKSIKNEWESRKENLSIRYFVNEFIPNKADIEQDKLRKEYEKRKEQFKIPEKVKASHILIKNGKKRSDAEAKKKINKIRDMIKKDGSNFNKLAKKYSEGPSASKGGELGYFTRGRMVKPFEDAAFSLKKGEFTKNPVKTKFGYHLIYVQDHKEGGYKKFKKVSKSLRSDIYKKMLKKEYNLNIKADSLKANDDKAIVATVEKLNLKYTLGEYKKELRKFMNESRVSRILSNKKAAVNTLEQILLRKIYEDKMKELDIYSSKDYKEYIKEKKNEFLVNRYVQNEVIDQVKVTEKDVDQYISYLKSRNADVSNIKKQQRQGIKQRIARTKKIKQYRNYVSQLKSKANINKKGEYKQTSKK